MANVTQADVFRKLAELSEEKAGLVDQISKIDQQMGELQQNGSVAALQSLPQKRRGRPPISDAKRDGKKKIGRKNQQRAKNEKSLPSLVQEILQGKKDGFTIGEITTKVREAGYKSNTKGDFGQIVYQTLYKMLNQHKTVAKEEDSGKYRIVA